MHSPLQHDLAFEFGVDIINHLQSPSTKFELIALHYSGSREIDNGVTPPTLISENVLSVMRDAHRNGREYGTDNIRRFLSAFTATVASMVTVVTEVRFTLLESFLPPSLTNGLNFHCTRVKNNQICELLPNLNSCC